MSQVTNKFSVQRILVPLDASSHSLSALEAAIELASNFNAELIGLFVEDTNLLRLAESPFAQEISLFTPVFRQMERKHLELQLQVQAEQMRKLLASKADSAGVPWKFRVSRGGVTTEVLAESTQADLTILGKVGWSLAGTTHVGSTVQTVISQSQCLTMIFQHGIRLEFPVLVLFTGSALSQKVLEIAAGIQKLRRGALKVLILADTKETYIKYQDLVKKVLENYDLEAECRVITSAGIFELHSILSLEGRGPLVLPCEDPYFKGTNLQELINYVHNPVLLVKESVIQ